MMYTSFYERPEWQDVRYRVLRKYGFKCLACGASKSTGAVIHVDHVKPIKVYPELALTESNLQPLCAACNLGKRANFEDDFRREEARPLSAGGFPRPHGQATPETEKFLSDLRQRLEAKGGKLGRECSVCGATESIRLVNDPIDTGRVWITCPAHAGGFK